MAVLGNTRNARMWVAATLATLLCSLPIGCAKKDERNVVIAPGQFVEDVPTKLAEGKTVKSKKCSVDIIDGEEKATNRVWKTRRGNGISVVGWAYQLDAQGAGAEIYLELTGQAKTYYAVTTTRNLRTDVNETFHVNPGEVGYRLTATTEQVEPGVYAVAVLLPTNGTVETCDGEVTIIVN